MFPRSLWKLAVVVVLLLAVVAPAAAQNPWVSDGGYYEQYDAPAGKFTPHVARWIWVSHFAPGVPQDYVAFFRCWRVGEEGGIGTNRFVLQWTLTGLDTDTVVKLPKWKVKLDEGFMDGQSHLVNSVAPLQTESLVIVEAKIILKGKIGAGEYVGCDLDLSEHPDGFDGSF